MKKDVKRIYLRMLSKRYYMGKKVQALKSCVWHIEQLIKHKDQDETRGKEHIHTDAKVR